MFKENFQSQNESVKMTKEQAIEKIADLEEQIEALGKDKQETLEKISQDTEDHSSAKKSERKDWEVNSLLDFCEGDGVANLEVRKTKKGKIKLEGNFIGTKKIELEPEDLESDLRDWEVIYDIEGYTTASKDSYKNYNENRSRYAAVYFDKKIKDIIDRKKVLERLYVDDIGKKDMFIAQAYESFLGESKKEKAGFIFEKIISSSLRRLALKFGDEYGFELEEIDPIDDVEYKIDILLKFNNERRGVEVSDEPYFEKGYQLTLHKDDDVYLNKLDQIKKVNSRLRAGQRDERLNHLESLALLKTDMELPEIMKKYNSWKKMRQEVLGLPGGPDRLFDASEMVEMLRGFFEDTHLDFSDNKEFEQKVREYFSEKNFV